MGLIIWFAALPQKTLARQVSSRAVSCPLWDTKFLACRYAFGLSRKYGLNIPCPYVVAQKTKVRSSIPDTETTIGEAPSEEKLSRHIYLTREGYEKIKQPAEYALVEGFIPGHPRRNFS
jgi:hypothetical protein